MNAYGLLPKILQKVKEAQRPERFTIDFLQTKLGFSGGSARPFIPFAKRIGLLNPDGSPTELYTRFRNPDQSGRAMAEAMRIGYAALFERNEYAHELSPEKLAGLVIETTGLEKTSTAARAISSSFIALKELADFEASEEESPPLSGVTTSAAEPIENLNRRLRSEGLHLSYTINLNLPETTNVAVFNAIFKSMKDHLLKE